jgi:hypothetical protein
MVVAQEDAVAVRITATVTIAVVHDATAPIVVLNVTTGGASMISRVEQA